MSVFLSFSLSFFLFSYLSFYYLCVFLSLDIFFLSMFLLSLFISYPRQLSFFTLFCFYKCKRENKCLRLYTLYKVFTKLKNFWLTRSLSQLAFEYHIYYKYILHLSMDAFSSIIMLYMVHSTYYPIYSYDTLYRSVEKSQT